MKEGSIILQTVSSTPRRRRFCSPQSLSYSLSFCQLETVWPFSKIPNSPVTVSRTYPESFHRWPLLQSVTLFWNSYNFFLDYRYFYKKWNYKYFEIGCYFLINLTIWNYHCLKYFNRLIGQVGRVFANDPGDLGSIPGHIITKKNGTWYLLA